MKGDLRPVLPVSNVPIDPGKDFKCLREAFLSGSKGSLLN